MAVVIIGTIAIFAFKVAIAQAGGLVAALHVEQVSFLGYEITAASVASIVASSINTLFIMSFNELYRWLGVKLTEWARPRPVCRPAVFVVLRASRANVMMADIRLEQFST